MNTRPLHEPEETAAEVLAQFIETETRVEPKVMMVQDYHWKIRNMSVEDRAPFDDRVIRSFGSLQSAPMPRDGNIPVPGSRDHVDVAIITITSKEHQMMQRALNIPKGTRPLTINAERYWRTSIPSEATGHELEVVLTMVGEQRNAACIAAMNRLFLAFDVNTCVLVGIAAGVKAKTKIGDVLVSTEVFDYEGGRAEPEGIRNRGNRQQSSRRIKNDLHFYETRFEEVQSVVGDQLAGLDQKRLPSEGIGVGFSPELHSGIIACGEKLLVDGSLNRIRESHDERIRGADMESYGFAFACSQQTPEVQWLVVRGVSDYGEPRDLTAQANLEPDKGDEWQWVAALTASIVAVDFLSTEYQPPTYIPSEHPMEEPF